MVACSIGRQLLAGRSRPPVAPGKPVCGGVPNPRSLYICQSVCGCISSAILEVPMLDDLETTWLTVIMPKSCVSPIVLSPIVSFPGAVCTNVSGRTIPRSSALAIAKGFMVEPGSNVSVSTRLRMFSMRTKRRELGSYVGQLLIARISPVRTSTTTTAPALA